MEETVTDGVVVIDEIPDVEEEVKDAERGPPIKPVVFMLFALFMLLISPPPMPPPTPPPPPPPPSPLQLVDDESEVAGLTLPPDEVEPTLEGRSGNEDAGGCCCCC